MPHDLVIVANRLPVDRVENPTGRPGGAGRPAAWSARSSRCCAGYDGVWMGWPGGTDAGPRAVRGRRARARADVDDGRGHRGPLRGLLQRHALAALPRPRRQAGVPPGVVGQLRRGQRAVRRGGGGGGRGERDRLGARLPAPAGAPDAARAAAGPAHRLLPAHPLPAGRAVPAAAVAPADPRGAPRRRPGRFQLPAAPQNFVRLVRQRVGHKTHRDLVYLPDGRTVRAAAFPISIDAAGFEALATSPRRRRGPTRSARRWATRGGCSSGWTGSTTPRASTRGCARSAS